MLVLLHVALHVVLWRLPEVSAAEWRQVVGLRTVRVMEAVDWVTQPGGEAPAGEVARALLGLLTYPVLACGPLQAFLCAVFLLAFGRRLEARRGAMRLLALLLLGSLAAGAAQVAWQPGQRVPVVGASGAVSAVVGAYAILHRRDRVRVVVPVVVVPVLLRLPALVVVGAWLALQIPALQRLLILGQCEPLSWAAVAAGFGAGAVLGPLLFRAAD